MSFGEADKLFDDKVKVRLQKLIETLAKVLVDAGIKEEVGKMRSQDAIGTPLITQNLCKAE